MKTRVFHPDAALLNAASASAAGALVAASIRQVAPVVEHVLSATRREAVPGLQWTLSELTVNACQALRRRGTRRPIARSELIIVVRTDVGKSEFEVLVKNRGRPSARDLAEIERRFRDYAATRKEIEALRNRHTGADGVVRLPGAAGGGGLAILECMRAAQEQGLFFDFRVESRPRLMTVFRVASFPPGRWAARPNPAS